MFGKAVDVNGIASAAQEDFAIASSGKHELGPFHLLKKVWT